VITFQLETIDQWRTDAAPLLYDHWQELGLDTDLKNDINFDHLRKLEAAGMWLTMTARDGDKLVGYVAALFSKHLHYTSSGQMLIVDMYYVAPEYRRGTGVKLLAFMEATARAKNAIKIYLSCKVHRDHSKLFVRMGYRLSDYAFTKRIGQ
jgi:GNAT superfamily N-acetyltransferase